MREKNATIRKILIVQREGGREVSRELIYKSKNTAISDALKLINDDIERKEKKHLKIYKGLTLERFNF